MVGKRREELETPCLVVREKALQRALERMGRVARERGVQLRPHIKAHKCTVLAKRQRDEGGAVGVAAAKPSESLPFLAAGLSVLLSSPVSHPSKALAVASAFRSSLLPPSYSSLLSVVVDSVSGVGLLASALRSCLASDPPPSSFPSPKLTVLIDIDAGNGRTGVLTVEEAFEVADEVFVHSDVMVLCGAQTYLGHVQHIRSLSERALASSDGIGKGYAILQALRESGSFSNIVLNM